jgi:hypothetical protein
VMQLHQSVFVGDPVRMRNGHRRRVAQLFADKPWAIVRYDEPQPYKEYFIRHACCIIDDLEVLA